MTGASDAEALRERAREWIAGDPDPSTARQLTQMLESSALERLADHVGRRLTFGTAGLRAVVGPGPNRMNRAVVIRATRGLAEYLLASEPEAARRGVVVGFDARHDSERFACDVVGVLVGADIETRWFTTPQPTPVVAYAHRVLGTGAAVVVTASHNPPEYNGYKVYGPDGSQIVPPVDEAIATAIEAVGPASEVPRGDPGSSPGVHELADDVIERYLDEIAVTVPSSPGPAVRVAYTPLHGVGGSLARRAMTAAGHREFHPVWTQSEPDPTWPTVSFPNPEEPGAMDAVTARGAQVHADLVVANDPDADRLAVAVPEADGGFRVLDGNQIGVLLADHLLASVGGPDALVVSSIVSTPMMGAVAAAHGARWEMTLTGFKWICSAARVLEHRHGLRFVYGFEEALGSCVDTIVRDKDGISAAVAFADLTRRALGQGSSVLGVLERLYREHGLWVGHQSSIAPHGMGGRDGVGGRDEIAAAMVRLSDDVPQELGGRRVVRVSDFRVGAEDRPAWLGSHDLVAFDLADGRAMIRPSGTEPKAKIYVDLRREVAGTDDPWALETSLKRDARAVADDLARFVGLL